MYIKIKSGTLVRLSTYNINYPINETGVSNFWWCYSNFNPYNTNVRPFYQKYTIHIIIQFL